MWCVRNTLLIVFVLLGLHLTARAENLILVTIDSLRAESLNRDSRQLETPAIESLGSQGIVFTKAFTETPLTLPAHSTLLTGTLPVSHGVRDNFGFRLPDDRETLAEFLAESGYRTAAIIGSSRLSERMGMAQGFQHFEGFEGEPGNPVATAFASREAEEVTNRAIDWLSGDSATPFFLWLHLDDLRQVHDRGDYWKLVQEIDDQLGRLLTSLRDSNLLDQTHLFLLGDHGQGLGDHGEQGHGYFLYDSTLHIPWIIRPAASFNAVQQRLTGNYSLVDVLPTALDLLGLPVPLQAQGRSARPEMQGEPAAARPVYAETYLPYLHFGWSRLKAVRLDEKKLIDAPRPELFDISQDPSEEENLAEQAPAEVRDMRRRLLELQSRYQSLAASEAIVSLPQWADRLTMPAAVASGGTVDPPEGVDPKDKVDVFTEYQALRASLDLPPATALEKLEQLKRKEPSLQGLHYLEGILADRQGDLERARSAYKKAVEADPTNHAARKFLASLELRTERPTEAQVLYQDVVETDPEDYLARTQLGLLWRMRGFREQALEEFKTVTEQAPDFALGWINRGNTHFILDQLKEAETSFRKAIQVDPSMAEAHFQLSRILEATGRTEEALLERELAAKLDPRFRP